MDTLSQTSYFPRQKLSSKEKTFEWGQKCIDAASNIIFSKQDWIRESLYNKKVNYNLANNIIDEEEIHKVFNPLGIQYGEFPASIQHFNKAMTKINLLVGEEWKRPFEWRVLCLNEDAISIKEEKQMEELMAIAQKSIQEEELDPKKLEQRIKQLDKYYRFSYQDVREEIATDLINYLWVEQRMQYKFNKGFQDALIAAEELYRTDIICGNPIIERVNPLNLFTLRNGDSNQLESAEIIVEICYMPIGKAIEEFYDELDGDEVDYLEKGMFNNNTGTQTLNYSATVPTWRVPDEFSGRVNNQGIIEMGGNSSRHFGGWFNEHGEVRVIRCRWKSRLKRLVKTYFDENGFQQEEIESEYYKPNKDLGETVRTIWINEWWEGTRIGDKIYKKVRPRPVQFRNMSNHAMGGSGYVGTYYNINDSKALSLMDRMRPFQYLYNIMWRKLELALARYDGPSRVMPMHLKPNGWTEEQWLYYDKALGMLMVDPFNEGQEGAATGKLAGSMNTVLPQYMEANSLGSYVQQIINLIDYLDNQIGEIAGISKQREGQISSNETVGGVERSVNQSTNVTEPWFIEHDDTKLRVLAVLLETAKVAFRDRKDIKIQYILDNLEIKQLQFDASEFVESEYGLRVTQSHKAQKLNQIYETLIQAGLQNDKLSFANVIDIYNSDSMASTRRKLETYEENKIKQVQEQQKEQLQAQQQMAQQQSELKQQELDRNDSIEREKLQNGMDIELLKIELEREKLGEKTNSDQLWARIQEQQNRLNSDLERQKLEADKELNQSKSEHLKDIDNKKLTHDKDKHNKEIEVKKMQVRKQNNPSKK